MTASPAFAKEAARAEFVQGKASAISITGQKRALAKGSKINPGDTIVSKEARVQLRFTDGAFISLAPHSRFHIKEYSYNGVSDGTELVTMELLEGALRTITGLIGKQKKEAYTMQTALATLGIRGTEYSISYSDGITGSVSGGAIVVCNVGGCLDVIKGQSYYVRDANTKPVLTEKTAFLPPPQPVHSGQATPHSSEQDEAEDTLASDEDTDTSSSPGSDDEGKNKHKSAKDDAKEKGKGKAESLISGVTSEAQDKTNDRKEKTPKAENAKTEVPAGKNLALPPDKVSQGGGKSPNDNSPGLDKKSPATSDLITFFSVRVNTQVISLETPVDSLSNKAVEKLEKGSGNSIDKPGRSPDQPTTTALSPSLGDVGLANTLNEIGKVKNFKLDEIIFSDIANNKKAPKVK